MLTIEQLKAIRQISLENTAEGPPARTRNQFFGVGPITDMTCDEVDARLLHFEYQAWIENTYPKLSDKGDAIGKSTGREFNRSIHRGFPADEVLRDMMHDIHRYFEFPKKNKMAVGIGGGHTGFTVCALHLLNANDPEHQVFIDTPRPESEQASTGGFFRQSWGIQLIELQRYSRNGDENRLHFSGAEGVIPSADELESLAIRVFMGVGHETTGAMDYSVTDIENLLEWIDRDPDNHHAVIDSTSMIGAMPWGEKLVAQVVDKCCMFMPLQKAIGGNAGYYIISLTPQALTLINNNQNNPSWSIPRQARLALPKDPMRPLSSEATTDLGPLYDPETETMSNGIINTYSTNALAETRFGLLRAERRIGSVREHNRRSVANRDTVNNWIETNDLLESGVQDAARRGAAVTLLKVNDRDINDPDIVAEVVARSKQLLGFEGITHANGEYEKGLDVARNVNAYPGTPGDFRAWIGGTRDESDIIALLNNIYYAYHRARIVVAEDLLGEQGVDFDVASARGMQRQDDPDRAYKVLIADLVGLKFDADGNPDHSQVKACIGGRGGVFHEGAYNSESLAAGKIHFFYQPDLSREAELLEQTADGQYDAVIAAATFLPADSKFELGGVRIGAGTGNMGSTSWGGGNGSGGVAALMNTPSFNSRATAQMAMKALLKVCPDLPVAEMHDLVVAGKFDTGKQLRDFPTEKLESKRIALIGYGNIGRELAKLARAFGMTVVVNARAAHKHWVESEGFIFAATTLEAATGADVISPHTGLGAFDADSKRFANEGLIDAEVLNAMNPGSIVINYDRGEIIDASALDAALTCGQVSYAGIDADLFIDAENGELTGPMVPYREMETRHRGKMELLPHAAADTEHLSRVQGAMQAVDQIYDAIQYRSITNLKGELPHGYTSAGTKTVNGVGKVSAQNIAGLGDDPETFQELRGMSETMAAFWGAMDVTTDEDRRQEMAQRYGSQLMLNINRYQQLLDKLGIQGPYAD